MIKSGSLLIDQVDHFLVDVHTEESIGTNAIALAKKLKKPFFLIPEYHYCSFFHDWYCYAIPLFASEQLVGLLDVSTISDPLIEEMITVINLLGDKITTNYIKNNGFKVFNQTSAQRRIGAEILTDKQMEVLRLVVNGRTEIAIALELGISIPTVKYHKKKIFKVLGASCSNEAIIKAVKIGLITIR